MTSSSYRQPWLHDRQIAVLGNATVLSAPDGALGAVGTGLLVDDRLVLATFALTLGAPGQWEAPHVISSTSRGAVTSLWACARNVGDAGPDPSVEVHTQREVVGGGLREQICVVSRSHRPVQTRIRLEIGSAAADLAQIKAGRPPRDAPTLEATPSGFTWFDRRHRTTVQATPQPARVSLDATTSASAGSRGYLEWDVELARGLPVQLSIDIDVARREPSHFDADPGAPRVDWSGISVRAADRRLDKLVDTGLEDLRCLLLRDPLAPDDVFAGAGTPWYLTLFGRDALWAARMMLPFDVHLAGGTLRTLARRQGTISDPETAQEPGKILHEVRRTSVVDIGDGLELPALYYGTVDATALWAIVLHDAWRSGLPPDEVRELLPHLQAAMAWNRRAADNDSGLLRYLDTSGHGLTNQGWKDSGDSMRRRDGSLAVAPIALLEAQAYAVEAARGAAQLYDAFGVEGAASERAWADVLAARIRENYWVTDADGPYLAMAIDGSGIPVDGVGSNMGHVLGTGVLSAAERDATIARLNSPDLLGEFGIGTLGRSNPAYNPIGYHTGSVWTHDSAIALLGMVREGQPRAGAGIARALVDGGAALGYRLPELFAGESVAGMPAPYPAACRPQAWAAASALAIVTALLGLSIDVPGSRIVLAPMRPAPFGPLTVTGLHFGAAPLTVSVDASGKVGISGLPDGVEVELE